jgi:hypothetical protein
MKLATLPRSRGSLTRQACGDGEIQLNFVTIAKEEWLNDVTPAKAGVQNPH